MKNTLPNSNGSLTKLGLTAAGALKTHQNTIGVMHNTESVVLGSLSGFTTSIDAFSDARFARSNGFIAQAIAFSDAGTFLNLAVDALIPYLGRTHGPAWAAAFGPSLAIPTTLPDRLEALRKLEKQLKDFPDRERLDEDEPSKEVSAARAKSWREALAGAISSVARCKSDVRQAKKDRASAKAALTKRLRGLINELTQLIPENDPRWTAFGFNAPGETQAPEAVQGVRVTGIGPGRLAVDWVDSARAERFLVEVLVVGQDAEFRRVATVLDCDTELSLPAGAKVKVRVIAANEAGESGPSAVVEITAPTAVAA